MHLQRWRQSVKGSAGSKASLSLDQQDRGITRTWKGRELCRAAVLREIVTFSQEAQREPGKLMFSSLSPIPTGAPYWPNPTEARGQDRVPTGQPPGAETRVEKGGRGPEWGKWVKCVTNMTMLWGCNQQNPENSSRTNNIFSLLPSNKSPRGEKRGRIRTYKLNDLSPSLTSKLQRG